MKLDIPYHSQFDEITVPEWKERGCAIACLKMCFDFLEPNKTPSVTDLFAEGQIIIEDMINKGLLKLENINAHGWPHDVVTLIAHNHGITSYREEFRSIDVDIKNKTFSQNINEAGILKDKGIQKIRETLENKKPVIVSVMRKNGPHQIVVVGFEDNLGTTTGFYINDPDNRTGEKQGIFMSLSEFSDSWKKFAIFVG